VNRETVVKVLETLKLLLGISTAVAAVWNATLGFDPQQIVSIIDIIITILVPGIAGGTLATNAGRNLLKRSKDE